MAPRNRTLPTQGGPQDGVLTPEERKVATEYAGGNSPSVIATDLGVDVHDVYTVLRRRHVRGWIDKIQDGLRQSAADTLVKKVDKAITVVVGLLDDDDPRIRLDAAREVLNRVLGKGGPDVAIQQNFNGPVSGDVISLTDEQLRQIAGLARDAG